jgi:hypothetical protein
MKKNQGLSTALIIFVIVAAVISGALAYRLIISPSTRHTVSICTSCFGGPPVGDIIIRQLAVGSSGKSNSQLNVTLGQKVNLTVEVFLSVNATVNASFNVRLSPDTTSILSESAFSVSFSPQSFVAPENKNASTIMTITTSGSAPRGLYSTEVVITDLQNQNYTWGSQIEINVE